VGGRLDWARWTVDGGQWAVDCRVDWWHSSAGLVHLVAVALKSSVFHYA
jgi:hypothetical protein